MILDQLNYKSGKVRANQKMSSLIVVVVVVDDDDDDGNI